MYPTLLFDMDGTLIDSADGVFQSLRYAMESVGGPELPRGAVRHFLGTPIERVLQTRFGCDAQTALLVRERFLNHYRDHGLYATVPVPGMVELTARLKTAGFRLAIATCKPWAYCGPTLAQCGFLDCFEAVSGSYHNGVPEEKAAVIRADDRRPGGRCAWRPDLGDSLPGGGVLRLCRPRRAGEGGRPGGGPYRR